MTLHGEMLDLFISWFGPSGNTGADDDDWSYDHADCFCVRIDTAGSETFCYMHRIALFCEGPREAGESTCTRV